MREYTHRVWLGAVVVLSLLAGACVPASISADTVPVSTSAPDLIINTITWAPEIPSIGEAVTFTVTIENQGSGQASPSRVAYYIDDTYQTSAPVNQIDPGAIATETFTWTALAGSHTIKAIADANNSVTESDETNNVKTFAFSVLAPDLIAEEVTWSPENPSIRDEVTFTVTIKNRGTSEARCSNVGFYIDGSSRGYRDVYRIDAGANVTITYPWTAQAGSHTIKAVADVLNQVSESDETNNDKTVNYSTSAPDLIISSITWSPANPSEGSTATFTVTIKNQGSGKADYSRVAYYIDDIFQSSAHVNQLNPGATTTKTFDWTVQAGSHNVKAIADVLDQVSESDENNNDKTATVSMLAPDLIIQNITWSPGSPLIDRRVTFTVTIKNQGKSRASYSFLYLYIDNRYRWQQNMKGLGAGATATAIFHWTPQATSHTIKAVADGENQINESNESNNTKTATVTCSYPSLSDLIVQDIVWSPENPSVEDTVTFTVSIKNQGSGQATPSHVAYYIDDTFQPLAYVDQIDPGATATKTFIWPAQAGPHTFKAVADYNNAVPESNESNNEKAVTLSTVAPDLVIQNITWSPLSPPIGNMVTFTVTIKNQGNYRARYSYVAYYIDGSSRGFHDVLDLEAGDTATTTFTWTALAGLHTIKAVADVENQNLESDENNNENVVTFPAPDLIVRSITWSPANPSENDTVTFGITIKNQGGGAGASSVYFYIDDSSEGYENVHDIDAEATVTKTFTWTALAGSHTIKAVADGENQLTESDEANNEKVDTFSVSLPPTANTTTTTASKSTSNITASPNQPEANVHLYDQSSQVPPGEDGDSNPPEKLPSVQASEKGNWLGWWHVLAVVVLAGIVMVVMSGSRQKPR